MRITYTPYQLVVTFTPAGKVSSAALDYYRIVTDDTGTPVTEVPVTTVRCECAQVIPQDVLTTLLAAIDSKLKPADKVL